MTGQGFVIVRAEVCSWKIEAYFLDTYPLPPDCSAPATVAVQPTAIQYKKGCSPPSGPSHHFPSSNTACDFLRQLKMAFFQAFGLVATLVSTVRGAAEVAKFLRGEPVSDNSARLHNKCSILTVAQRIDRQYPRTIPVSWTWERA
jgi:hypothetical protein